MTPTTANPELPVWATVAEAFATVPANFVALLRIFWAWLAILFVVLPLLPLLLYVLFPNGMSSLAGTLAVLSWFALIIMIALSSAAVAWHRLLLLGEQPPHLYLRLGAPVPRYVGRLLVIILIATAVQILCALPLWRAGVLAPPALDAPPSAEDLVGQALAALIMSVAAILVATRLSISLPGIAVEQPMTLGDTLRLTRDNAWRQCGGTLLIYAPSFVLGSVFEISAASSNISATLLVVCAAFFSAVATISFLSLCYRFFTRAPAAAQPRAV